MLAANCGLALPHPPTHNAQPHKTQAHRSTCKPSMRLFATPGLSVHTQVCVRMRNTHSASRPHLTRRTLCVRLLGIDLAPGEAPTRAAGEAAQQQHTLQGVVHEDGPIDRDGALVDAPIVQD